MKWVRFRVRTVSEAEDLIISEMSELGMCGAQIEDNVPLTASEKERIYTFDADDPQNKDIADGEAYVSFYAELDESGMIRMEFTPDDECFSTFDFSTEENEEADSSEEEDIIESIEVRTTPDEQRRLMEECLAGIREHAEIGAGTVAVSQMDDSAWKDKWKEYFHSFMIDDILVMPSWEEEPKEAEQAKYILHIDPGTAFGTGAHETTQLAIRAIRKLIGNIKSEAAAEESSLENKLDNDVAEQAEDGDKQARAKAGIRLLDIGTGSGILSVMALMFGAETCVGTDLDSFTEEAVRENLEANHIDGNRFKLILGNIIDDDGVRSEVLKESEIIGEDLNAARESCPAGYDIVVANILPVVLVPLTPTISPFIKPGGYYVTSGILTEKKAMMESIIRKAGLEIVETAVQGEWCSITAKKPM